jgi:hypothetical protein
MITRPLLVGLEIICPQHDALPINGDVCGIRRYDPIEVGFLLGESCGYGIRLPRKELRRDDLPDSRPVFFFLTADRGHQHGS